MIKHIFGPVQSRRLGLSLGIDLIPFKTCTLDCIYCECGKTTNLTIKRKVYIKTQEIIDELTLILKNNPKLDYITFAGSGEPTLATNLGEIISYIKQHWPSYKIAILTNGTLLFDPEVRTNIALVDLVIPSLDAGTNTLFQKINIPENKLDFNSIINGLIAFRKEFAKDIWLEIFIIPTLNDSEKELIKLKEIILRINPNKVQLNTLDRPGTESWIKPISKTELIKIADFLKPIKTEITASFKYKSPTNTNQNPTEQIVTLLKRRPCTIEDLTATTNTSANNVKNTLKILLNKNSIIEKNESRGTFYSWSTDS
jgi:wyosine [tRNA(Phe)-imidazoG37] synthetase (radical SAM superfamily)